MTLTINDTTMTSDQTAHTARQAPGSEQLWCCPALKTTTKAAFTMPMWGAGKPRSRGGCGALVVKVPVAVGEVPVRCR